MLGKFKIGTEWILPLTAHASVHAAFTLAIASVYGFAVMDGSALFVLRLAALLALLDFVVHFIVDRIKASPNLLGRWKPDSPYFWWALGADQMAHHLCHYVIIYILLHTAWF